jgi:hypothetical protein
VERFDAGNRVGRPFCALRRLARSLPFSLFVRLERRKLMLWTILLVLLILWALGLVSGYTLGGLIHILLVIGLVVLIIQLIQGRRVV